MMPSSWYFCPCVSPSSWVWDGVSDLLLTNRIQQRCWHATSNVKSLLRLSDSISLLRLLLLPGVPHSLTLRKVSCHIVSCDNSKAHMTRNWSLSQQPVKACSPPSAKWVSLEADPLLTEPYNECRPHWYLECRKTVASRHPEITRHPAKLYPGSWPTGIVR